jgi:hypothetical protein|nr:MAG TPA: chitin synthase regulator [Bacteriophage sp.]
MKWSAIAIYVLLVILFCIVFYGLIIGGILGFLHLLMEVFNLGF